MGKLRDRLRKRSEEARTRIRSKLKNIEVNKLIGDAKEKVVEEVIEEAKEVLTKYNPRVSKKKGIEGLADGTIAGSVGVLIGGLVMASGKIPDKYEELVALGVSAIVTGIVHGIRRLIKNRQKFK